VSKQNQEEVFLIDASIYIFRYYFSLPDNWWSKSDFPTAAVYGYTHWLIRFLKNTSAPHVAACFDESLDSCFRNAIYADYKASRALPDENLAFQLEACKQMTRFLGIPAYASLRYEADDLIATLAKKSREKNFKVNILSRDKDLSQLVLGERDIIWDYPDGEAMDASGVLNKMAVQPQQVADYLAIVGDSSDDIPGVPGVGPKTAAALLKALTNWENIKNNLPAVGKLKIRGAISLEAKLREYAEQVDMAVRLTQVVDNAPLGQRFNIARKKINKKHLLEYGFELGFGKNFSSSVNKLVEVL